MAKDLRDIVGHLPLTEALRSVMSGVPNPFPSELFTVKSANRILGDRAKYIRISGERRTSKKALYGSPAVKRTLKDIADQTVRCMHTFESFGIDPVILQSLRSFEQYEQDKGMDWLSYQIDEAARRHVNTRVISTASVLRYGAIYWDSAGQLLPTSSGANETFDFNVPATHKDQCNGNISASWALHTTDIMGDIRNLKQYAVQETGLEFDTALYGVNLPKYISQNDYAMSYLSRNAGMNEKILSTGEIPEGFGGVKNWIPVYTSFFESDDSGTVSEIWDDDLMVLLPPIKQPDKMTWWAMFEGSFPVPRSIEVSRDPMGALGNFETVYGAFSYGAVTINPPGMEIYHGDTWLPGLRNEKAIFMADVAF